MYSYQIVNIILYTISKYLKKVCPHWFENSPLLGAKGVKYLDIKSK